MSFSGPHSSDVLLLVGSDSNETSSTACIDVDRPSSSTSVRRPPMDQAEFDRTFGYNSERKPPKGKERKSCNLAGSCTTPFRSPRNFYQTLSTFVPIVKWLPNYEWRRDLGADVLAGCTLAVMHIPQGIAYGILAGLPAISGLYLSMFAPFLYMFFGTARHNSIGTFAVVSLMTKAALESVAARDDVSTSEAASSFALTVGLVHLSMALLRLEVVTTYFSDAVVGGFSTGAACHVFVSQLRHLFGLARVPHYHGVGMLIRRVLHVLRVLPSQVNTVTVTVAAVCITVLTLGKFWINPFVKRRFGSSVPIPFELITLISAAAVSKLLELQANFDVKVVGKLPSEFPTPELPRLDLLPELVGHAVSVCAVVAAIHISLAKMMSKRFGYSVDASQEFRTFGLLSVISSVFPVYPAACSLSRTIVNADVGGRTQLTSFFSSAILALVILKIGQYLESLPMCVLCTIIIVALTGMFRKFAEPGRLWRLSRLDCSIWLVSFLATVLTNVSLGLVISVAYALFTVVIRTQWPRSSELTRLQDSNDFGEVGRFEHDASLKDIRIFRFDSPLLFTNADRFKREARRIALDGQRTALQKSDATPLPVQVDNRPHFLVLDCSSFSFIDVMGLNAVKELRADLGASGVALYLAGATAAVRDLFERYQEVDESMTFFPSLADAVFRIQSLRPCFKFPDPADSLASQAG